jgi:hypothetical protein
MTLKIGWLHEAEQSLGTWLHEADDWQGEPDYGYRPIMKALAARLQAAFNP